MKRVSPYELSNHLGNVLTVITDRKIPVDANNDFITDYYLPDVISSTDYYAFGQSMPGRTFNRNAYPAGMNGQLKDDEIFTGAYTAEFWEYDSRIGRRWETDPIVKPWESPYACFYNNPVVFSDYYGLDGDDETKPRPGQNVPDGDKKTGGEAKRDWEAAGRNAPGTTGYDGKNDWKSRVDGDNTIVQWHQRDNNAIGGYWSFPTSKDAPVDNGDDGGQSNPNSTAGSDTSPIIPPTNSGGNIPSGGASSTPPTGGGSSTPSGGGGGGRVRPVINPPCNAITGNLTFNWVVFQANPTNRRQAVFDITTIALRWQPCNTSVRISVSTPWPRNQAFLPNSQWSGQVPFRVMLNRANWIQNTMINTGRIPRSAFLAPQLLFDQPAGSNPTGRIDIR